ncbi:sushi domain-containing protein 2 isoform X1 [Octopus bimaculoides]|uniref:sushi domain-containing protein 2 isoform X1 n=1 Tax=Octopus bimaculoides TaxID=37653 RepID=UPI0022E81BDA|nr:sushi domain-containing protein 2 isoform X1 [Octopus bimaculoides]
MCSDVLKTTATAFRQFSQVNNSILISVLLLLTFSQGLGCMSLPLSEFFPFNNTTYGFNTTEISDDGSSPAIRITNVGKDGKHGFPLFQNHYETLYVNTNGIISFTYKESSYTPVDFPRNNSFPVIAPFWADIDIESVGGTVYYLESSDENLLALASAEVRKYFPYRRNYNAKWIFIATWYNVGYYQARDLKKNLRNTFQAVLITDWEQSFAIFNYNKIQWVSRKNQTSSGSREVQISDAAMAGLDAGNGAAHYQIEGTRSALNISQSSNIGTPGKWFFRIDLTDVQFEPCMDEKLSVTPRFGHMLGGQPLTLYGLCFPQVESFTAVFKELNITFPCMVKDILIASCVTPMLYTTGDFTLNLNFTPKQSMFEEKFSVVNFAMAVPRVIREQPRRWIIGSEVFISWNASELPSSKFRVDLLGLELNGSFFKWHLVKNFHSTGEHSMTLALEDNLLNYSTAIIRVLEDDNRRQLSFPVTLWSDMFPVNGGEKNSQERCERWLAEDHPNLDINPNMCPCALRQASRDTSRYQKDPLCNTNSPNKALNCIYHPKATECVILNSQSTTNAGQSCCYGGRNNSLLEWQSHSDCGYVYRYNNQAQGDGIVPHLTHFESDIIPFLHCCMYSGKQKLCQKFFQWRPATKCNAYNPPSPAQAAGDPHLVTLDGKKYTFNGLGEFILLQDKSKSVVIQVRAAQARDIDDKLQNATVFTGIAMKMKGISEIIEIEINEQTNYRLLLDEKEYKYEKLEFQGLTINIHENHENSTDIMVVFSSHELSIEIEVTPDVMNILVLMGSKALRNNVEGLLGNYNGNISDDFRARDGTIIPTSSSMEDIHYKFGNTWRVAAKDSLFSKSYKPATPEEDNYQPVFIDKLDENNLRNGTIKLCGDVAPCRFDFQVIGKPSVALAIKNFVAKFSALKKDIEIEIRCPSIEFLENGNMTISGHLPGDYALFQCDPGFTHFHAHQLLCSSNGTWNGTVAKCLKSVADTGQPEVWYYWAGGTGALLALILIFLIIFFKCRRPSVRQTFRKDDVPLPPIVRFHKPPQPIFTNSLFLQSLQRLHEGGDFRIPRPTFIDPKIYEDYF